MKLSVPVVHWRVISPERQPNVVIRGVADERPLEVDVIERRLSRQANFAKIADMLRERRRNMQYKLSHVEATLCSRPISAIKGDISKAAQPQRRIGLSWSPRSIHMCHRGMASVLKGFN